MEMVPWITVNSILFPDFDATFLFAHDAWLIETEGQELNRCHATASFYIRNCTWTLITSISKFERIAPEPVGIHCRSWGSRFQFWKLDCCSSTRIQNVYIWDCPRKNTSCFSEESGLWISRRQRYSQRTCRFVESINDYLKPVYFRAADWFLVSVERYRVRAPQLNFLGAASPALFMLKKAHESYKATHQSSQPDTDPHASMQYIHHSLEISSRNKWSPQLQLQPKQILKRSLPLTGKKHTRWVRGLALMYSEDEEKTAPFTSGPENTSIRFSTAGSHEQIPPSEM